MEFRRLGESGLEVSVICLGTMMFGDRTDAAAAQRIIDSAFDAGVNFIDTADVYAKGASEAIVGPAMAGNRGWRIAEVVALSAELNVPQPVVCQPYYNAFNRMPEVEVLPACDYYGLGVVPYSPLARGVLTGKYVPGAEPPAESRVGRKDRRIMETEFHAESLAMAQTIKAHAEKK